MVCSTVLGEKGYCTVLYCTVVISKLYSLLYSTVCSTTVTMKSYSTVQFFYHRGKNLRSSDNVQYCTAAP